jgi:hypothetical protein
MIMKRSRLKRDSCDYPFPEVVRESREWVKKDYAKWKKEHKKK